MLCLTSLLVPVGIRYPKHHVLHIRFLHLPTLSWRWSQHPGRNKARSQERSCLFILALPKLVCPQSSLFSISWWVYLLISTRPKIFIKSRQITSLASTPLIWLATMSLKTWNCSARIYTLWGYIITPKSIFLQGLSDTYQFLQQFFK